MAFWRHKCHKICLIHQLLTENRLERNLSFEWESCQSFARFWLLLLLFSFDAHHLDIVTPSKEIYYYSLTKHFDFSHFVNVKVCGVSSLLFFVFFFFLHTCFDLIFFFSLSFIWIFFYNKQKNDVQYTSMNSWCILFCSIDSRAQANKIDTMNLMILFTLHIGELDKTTLTLLINKELLNNYGLQCVRVSVCVQCFRVFTL